MHKALGKGLEALIPSLPREQEREESKDEKVHRISLNNISPNRFQPRVKFSQEKLKELAGSIKEKGVVQPVIVSKREGRYELIAGERRFRAARLAGIKEIPAIIRDVPENEIFEISLIENIQREDLTPIEEAEAYSSLLKASGISQEDLARRLGRGRSAISNTLRLLSLPEKIKGMINNREISAGHARALLSIDENERENFLNVITREDLSVRDAEQLARKIRLRKRKPVRKEKGAEIIEYEERLQHALGTKVRITNRAKKGKIEIYFYSEQDFQRILKHLQASKKA